MRPLGCLAFLRFYATFRLSVVFALFCPYHADVPGLIQHPNTLLSILLSFYHLSFRLVLERERGSGEELQGLWIGLCDRKMGARVWMSKFFPFSSLSHL